MRDGQAARQSVVVTLGGLPISGKSTVAKLLAETRPKTVRIELDGTGIGHVCQTLSKAERTDLESRDINLEVEDSASVAANWIERNFDVVLVGLFNKDAVDSIAAQLDKRVAGIRYYSFALVPPLSVSLQPRGSRRPDEKEKTFIKSLSKWFEPHGYRIDNQNQTPQATAEEILRQLPPKYEER
ncbi:MAG: hypothetical protein GKR89_26515 [Candidatus Latescibacteria bacterium]|nr:hypothetical protein [Candidatus Latescibacterota bacterium]